MNSADTADQMMKMTLEGIQVAAEIGLKAGGTAAKSLAVTLYAIISDNKKIKGKIIQCVLNPNIITITISFIGNR